MLYNKKNKIYININLLLLMVGLEAYWCKDYGGLIMVIEWWLKFYYYKHNN